MRSGKGTLSPFQALHILVHFNSPLETAEQRKPASILPLLGPISRSLLVSLQKNSVPFCAAPDVR